MNWQEFIVFFVVVASAAFFVWRALRSRRRGPKCAESASGCDSCKAKGNSSDSGSGCGCGC